jgi:hypothetical protein
LFLPSDFVDFNIILVNSQLDALFLMYLFHFCTRFEQPSAHHQENQLYQYIIWYLVGDRLVCLTGVPEHYLHRVIPDGVLIQWSLLMMSTGLLETRREVK